MRHQVTAAILNLKTAQERLKVAQAAVAQAKESLRLIRLRYEAGLTILVDLLTAEDANKNADLSRVTALFDTYLAQAGLELALGTISGPGGEGKDVEIGRRQGGHQGAGGLEVRPGLPREAYQDVQAQACIREDSLNLLDYLPEFSGCVIPAHGF